jgi:hypothetical protein
VLSMSRRAIAPVYLHILPYLGVFIVVPSGAHIA